MARGGRTRVMRAVASAVVIVAIGVGLAFVLHVGSIGATTSLSLPKAAVVAEAQDGMTPISDMTAPPIHLIDQDGRPFSLARLRGHAVILTFLDPVCWDQCPLMAQEMKLSLRDLPASMRSRVDLVAVAANTVVHNLGAIRTFDRAEGLNGLANWYFVTSPSLGTLSRVWREYYVSVTAARNQMADHTIAFYLIAPNGQVRYLSQPDETDAYFLGTSELLASYTAHILGAQATFPSVAVPTASLLPRFATGQASHAATTTVMEGSARGWRVTWQGGYELLEATADQGRAWHDVSPAGVTARGGIYAAFGTPGTAWVVVLPWGYTDAAVTFYTDNWGATWHYTGVHLAGILDPKVAMPLAANAGRSFWLTSEGLFEADGAGAWRRVAPLPAGVPNGASLALGPGGSVELRAGARVLVWRAAGGWRQDGA